MKKGICIFLAAVIVISAAFAPMIRVKALTEEETYLSIAEKYRLAMTAGEASVSFPEYELPAEYAEKLYYYVLVTNPSLYYVAPEYNPEKATFSADGKYLDAYEFEYILTDTEQMDNILESKIADIADEIFVPSMHTVDMLLAIHEYIASNVDKPASRDDITEDMLCSSIYGAAVYGCADSRGYSLLFKVLAEKYTGSDCIIVADDTYSLYWNMYRLGTNWYNIDVYSDDLENTYYDVNDTLTDAYLIGGNISHVFFLVTTSTLGAYGHVSGEALTYAPSPTSETDTIRIRIWTNVMSKMCYYGEYWNYVSPINVDRIVKRVTTVPQNESSEVMVAEADNAIWGFTIYDDTMYFLSGNDSVHKRTADGMNDELLYTVAENEYLIGMNDRDGNAFYEIYNIDTGEYKYVRITEAKSDGKMNINVKDEYVCGFYVGSKLIDLLADFSHTGLVSQYESLNNVSVFDGDNQITDPNAVISSGMTVKLSDGTTYIISVTGDIDSNGRFNILDIMNVLSAISDEDRLTKLQQYSADYVADDSINIADAALMMSDLIPKSDAQILPETDVVE